MADLDPRRVQDFTGHQVIAQLFETPIRRRRDGSFELVAFAGRLRMRTAHGGTSVSWQARVRSDLRFSDGTPVTAEDVARAVSQLEGELRAEARGDTVVLFSNDADVVPEALLSQRQCAMVRDVGGALYGTGPYQVESASDSEVVLVANPHALRTPKIPKVIVRQYAADRSGVPTALREALRSGEVDLTTSLPRGDVTDLAGVRKQYLPGVSTAMFWMNLERPHFADVRARRAIALAIDRYALTGLCYENPAAFVARGVLPRGLWAGSGAPLRMDLDGARELLREAGVTLPPKLRVVTVWGPRPYLPRPTAVAEALGRQLAALGTELEWLVPADSDEHVRLLEGGDFDCVLGGWIADTPDPADFLQSILGSDRILGPDCPARALSSNYSKWRDSRFDAAVVTARRTGDAGAIEAALDRVSEDVPLVPLMYSAGVVVSAWRVQGTEECGIDPDIASLSLRE